MNQNNIFELSKLPPAIAIYCKKANDRKWLPFNFKTLKVTSVSKGDFCTMCDSEDNRFYLNQKVALLKEIIIGYQFKISICNEENNE